MRGLRGRLSDDSGVQQETVFGPANLANQQECREIRSTLAVIRLVAGVHTIEPFVHISGVTVNDGVLEMRCFTAEGQTS